MDFRHWPLTLAWLCCGATGMVATAQEFPAPAERQPIFLHFEGGNLEQNTAEMLSAVSGTKLVSFTAYVNKASPTPAAFARNELNWPDGVLNDRLSAALCLRNPHICSVSSGKAIWRLDVLGASASAADSYRCDSGRLPSYVICMPDVMLSSYTTAKRVSFNPKLESLSQKVVENLRGCESFNDGCESAVQRLNPAGTVIKDGVTTMKLPVKAYRLEVTGDEQLRDELTTLQEQVGDNIRKKNGFTRTSPDMRVTEPALIKAQSVAATEPAAVELDPLVIMGMPAKVPPRDASLHLQGPVVVGVWDGYADVKHCMLMRDKGPAVIAYKPAAVRPDVSLYPARTACGARRAFRGAVVDHAVFVTSLIAGGKINGRYVGAAPEAQIWQLESVGTSLGPDPVSEVLMNEARELYVLNFSQNYQQQSPGRRTELEGQLIDPDGEQKYPLVIVAAAGNNKREIKRGADCNVLPACWSQQPMGAHVISVVALDASGEQVLTDSNYGSAFDVAAIGDTSGAVYGDAMSSDRGTSYATPYVSALAALLYERVHRRQSSITPLKIKNRILFTSTFMPGLENAVRFGRIDYGRALDFKQAVLVAKGAACAGVSNCTLRGYTDPNSVVTVIDAYTEQGETVRNMKFKLKDIKRLAAASADGNALYWIAAMKDGVLRRYHKALIDTGSLQLDSGATIALADVLDYTACSFTPECERK